jgi:hypothetical protein
MPANENPALAGGVSEDGHAATLIVSEDTSTTTPAQEQVLINLREAGATATHTHGLDQAIRVLESWGLLRGRSS